jgi:hypothetical protein
VRKIAEKQWFFTPPNRGKKTLFLRDFLYHGRKREGTGEKERALMDKL